MTVDPGNRAEDVARAIAEKAAFRPIDPVGFHPLGVRTGFRASWVWVGERGLRRRGTSSTTRLPMAVVFGAGILLGAVDAYIAGSVVVGAYWALGGAAVAGIFWLRYGGTYESELLSVEIARPVDSGASSSTAVSVAFAAGRIRCQIRAGLREPSAVSAPLRLAREVGSLSREFRKEVAVA